MWAARGNVCSVDSKKRSGEAAAPDVDRVMSTLGGPVLFAATALWLLWCGGAL